jgi:hypothetical protein
VLSLTVDVIPRYGLGSRFVKALTGPTGGASGAAELRRQIVESLICIDNPLLGGFESLTLLGDQRHQLAFAVEQTAFSQESHIEVFKFLPGQFGEIFGSTDFGAGLFKRFAPTLLGPTTERDFGVSSLDVNRLKLLGLVCQVWSRRAIRQDRTELADVFVCEYGAGSKLTPFRSYLACELWQGLRRRLQRECSRQKE